MIARLVDKMFEGRGHALLGPEEASQLRKLDEIHDLAHGGQFFCPTCEEEGWTRSIDPYSAHFECPRDHRWRLGTKELRDDIAQQRAYEDDLERRRDEELFLRKLRRYESWIEPQLPIPGGAYPLFPEVQR